MKRQSKYIMLFFSMTVVFIQSCKKEWLEAKPLKSLAIPHTLRDYKSLISSSIAYPGFNVDFGSLTEYGAGDFVVDSLNLSAARPNDYNFYTWAPDLWAENNNYGAWINPYSKIIYTNVVLDGIESITPTSNAEQLDWNQTKGGALFFRAIWHYDVARQFSKAYDKNTSSTDLGIPLRLNADFNEVSVRPSIEETYSQILTDLKQAASLLPIATPINTIYKCQPTKTAAYAMLARVYLSMSKYDSALAYADKTLNNYSTLLDYNNASPNPAGPSSVCTTYGEPAFARFNDEVIFHMVGASYTFFSLDYNIVDHDLFDSYDINDWRKQLFFRNPTPYNTIAISGSYEPSGDLWLGLATDEIFLIRAECRARANNISGAMDDLNSLLRKRWKTGTFADISAVDANDAIRIIIRERRKELLMRGLRWTDLKRLNLEPQFAETVTKVINGQTYSLLPNSPLYVFSIPPNVIQLTGMPQNPR